MVDIPKSHPRYVSLVTRDKMAEGLEKGWIHETGLIAHGRGETFDYLLGEETIKAAEEAEKTSAALLLQAEKPVVSVNGNVVTLAAEECVKLAESIPALLEVNLFHRSQKRINKLVKVLKKYGADKVYGQKGDARIPGLEHDRAVCDRNGIFSADVVFVPLEDGDRCKALKNMGKKVIAVDLNPVSRTAKTADVTIVDNVVRAIPNIRRWVNTLKKSDEEVSGITSDWDNQVMLREVLSFLSKRLNSLY